MKKVKITLKSANGDIVEVVEKVKKTVSITLLQMLKNNKPCDSKFICAKVIEEPEYLS